MRRAVRLALAPDPLGIARRLLAAGGERLAVLHAVEAGEGGIGGWSYVADNRGDHRELFDLTLDPAELNNVASAERAVQEEMHGWLVERIGGLPPYFEGEAVAPVKR